MSEDHTKPDGSIPVATLSTEHTETSALLHSKCAEAHTTIIERGHYVGSDDEESQCGFWGEGPPFYDSETHSFWSKSPVPIKRKHRSLHDIICFWSATAMSVLTASLLCWALISNFSQYEFSFGIANWSMNHSAPTARSQHELRFCLSAPNRGAPTAQTWQFLPPSDPFACTTEIITLSADSSDYWKVHASNDIVLGDPSDPSIRIEEGARFVGVEARIRALELGDDLADEGNARG